MTQFRELDKRQPPITYSYDAGWTEHVAGTGTIQEFDLQVILLSVNHFNGGRTHTICSLVIAQLFTKLFQEFSPIGALERP